MVGERFEAESSLCGLEEMSTPASEPSRMILFGSFRWRKKALKGSSWGGIGLSPG